MRSPHHPVGWPRLALLISLGLGAARSCPAQDPNGGGPEGGLPPHIIRLTLSGERADFSHDGKRVLFLEKTFGDVYEIDLESRQPRVLTGHYPHHGYTRALCLPAGNVLLSGPERLDPTAERELTFSAYGHQGTDVRGVDLETKEVTNHSGAPDQYAEVEGVLPDGKWTLVECDPEGLSGRAPGHVDIRKLSLTSGPARGQARGPQSRCHARSRFGLTSPGAHTIRT